MKNKMLNINFIVFIIIILLGTIFYYEHNNIIGNIRLVQGDKKQLQNSNITQNDNVNNNKTREDIEDRRDNLEMKLNANLISRNNKKTDNSYDSSQVVKFVNGNYVKDGIKMAFLTFDDGPSTTVTPQVLATLRENGINATFFLIGEMIDKDDQSKALVKEELDEGNAIGNHTYTHEYRIHAHNSLYYGNRVDVGRFMDEIDQTDHSISNAIGQDYKTTILRMPGGYISRRYYHDPNLPAFDEALKAKNMEDIDWNAYDGDSDGKPKNANQIFEEAKTSIADQEKVVLLMHDTYGKEETAKALPRIIEYLRGQGYQFKTIGQASE